MKWQPIEIAMPEAMVPVLVYNGKQVFIEQWWGYDFTFDHSITHWMPLPEAPDHGIASKDSKGDV